MPKSKPWRSFTIPWSKCGISESEMENRCAPDSKSLILHMLLLKLLTKDLVAVAIQVVFQTSQKS